MQYLHLVYLSDGMVNRMHRDERCSDTAAVSRLARQGLRAGIGRCNGNSLVTDGPFVETKEYRVSS
jgi:hypothetical protein